ncbi:ComEA family DNA-binding protein [Candidatus Venteria ishoeyi]|uniref:ComE operon protein 1 n=1 Tax=Candidatus Venteria ishoeyi TaxID=1899563 RepID=A0A1H6F728_9GAMM|nr:helix-hairpin-helix domain-containing protein [Candidatus Venteria ishoeyi]SEH05928.1 ComE operon protein 1 [Candidatus Venteria ishoeyi]
MKYFKHLLVTLFITAFYFSPAFADSQKIDINAANVTLLSTLAGIGEKKAQAIVDYRSKNGPFKSINGLEQVNGIGPKTIEKNKSLIMVKIMASKSNQVTTPQAPVTPAVTETAVAAPTPDSNEKANKQ